MKFNSNHISSLFKESKFNEVIEYLDILLKQDKNSSNYYFLKGFAYLSLHKLSSAIKNLTSAINFESNNSMYYFYRGLTYFKQNKFDEAKSDYNKAISIKPSSPEYYNNLAQIHYTIGENELAIENFKKSFDLNNKLEPSILGLINTLSQTKDIESNDSEIISTHNKLNKINFDYSTDKHIKDFDIKDFLKKIDTVVSDKIGKLDFNITQTFREQKTPPNCSRHHKMFNTFNAIPKFCFGCYKVQIDVENVIDLIKLYIVFDNVNFRNDNIRKCMIELRPNIKGKYKGLIFCSSIAEAEEILNMLREILNKNLNRNFENKIKRGCSEYGFQHPSYDSLKDNAMTYNSSWEKYEKKTDEKYPELTFDKLARPTLKGITLFDVLVIRNWLAYAKLIGDESHKNISDQIFNSKFVEHKLKLKNS